MRLTFIDRLQQIMDNGVGDGGSSRFFVMSCGINHVLDLRDLDIMIIREFLKLGCPFDDIRRHRVVQLGLFLLFEPSG